MKQESEEVRLEYRVQSERSNGLAIAALACLLVAVFAALVVMGLSGFTGMEIMIPVMLLVPVGSLAALVTGLAALDSMDRRPEITRGKWMAMVGIYGGAVLCLLQCVMFFMVWKNIRS